MKKFKILLMAAMALLLSASTAPALTVLDFEGLPTTYYFHGGRTNIGAYYPGVTFGPEATILDKVIYGYSYINYPSHSGNAVFFTDSDDHCVDIIFDNTVTYVEGWFTFMSGGTMDAYDSSGNLVDSAYMGPNLGSTSMMSVSGAGIKRVRVDSSTDNWVGDDIAYEQGITQDQVGVLKAVYKVSKEKLLVKAMTDDPEAVLTVETANEASFIMENFVGVNRKGFSVYKLVVKGAANPGATITVTSTRGGSRTKPVTYR